MTKQKKEEGIEAAGWVFFLITFAIMLGPCNLLGWHLRYEQVSPAPILAFSTTIAAIGAGLVTWGANGVIQARRQKQRKAERKESKRRKQRS